MKRYECVKELIVSFYDDNGRYEEKENIIEVGSIWVIEEEKDSFRMIGGEIRLLEEGVSEYGWLEINQASLKEYFKEIE